MHYIYIYRICYFQYQIVWIIWITLLSYRIVSYAGSYKVDRSKISVSGLSTGGAMATQMHVAYSSVFMGVGIVAGSEYTSIVRSTVVMLFSNTLT